LITRADKQIPYEERKREDEREGKNEREKRERRVLLKGIGN